jgi:hypothetical protein
MAVARVDPSDPPSGAGHSITRSRPWAHLGSRVGPVVLAAVMIGAVMGALSCVETLSAGGHTTHVTVVEETPSAGEPAHAGHLDSTETSAVEKPVDGRGTHGSPEPDSGAFGHSGMACVVGVDLRFPEPFVSVVADACDVIVLSMPAGHAAEPDPPIPRFS